MIIAHASWASANMQLAGFSRPFFFDSAFTKRKHSVLFLYAYTRPPISLLRLSENRRMTAAIRNIYNVFYIPT